ncbi:MAG: ribonuclease HI [Solirubrobacteraceae bacterium]
MKVVIYTDGACSKNPGPGGYGIVMQLAGTNYCKEYSGGFKNTTNNRMELMAVIVALEKLNKPNIEVDVFTDSKYVHDAIEKKWIQKWVKINFKDKKNKDLWLKYLEVSSNHKVKINWVKGHAGNVMNERADKLATEAIKNKNLLVDL